MSRKRLLIIALLTITLTTIGTVIAQAIRSPITYNPTPFPGVAQLVPISGAPGGRVNVQLLPPVVAKLDHTGKVVEFIPNPMLLPPQ